MLIWLITGHVFGRRNRWRFDTWRERTRWFVHFSRKLYFAVPCISHKLRNVAHTQFQTEIKLVGLIFYAEYPNSIWPELNICIEAMKPHPTHIWRWRGTSTTSRVSASSSSDNCESSVDPSPRTLLMLWYGRSYTPVLTTATGFSSPVRATWLTDYR